MVSTVAWYGGNSGKLPHPVGTKSPNALGLYDMSGNVWEMCYDESMGFCVQRGGSYLSDSVCCNIQDSSGDSTLIDPFETGIRLVVTNRKRYRAEEP